jgi:diacylglycerol kinase (ATP)
MDRRPAISRLRSFSHAWRGLWKMVREESNAQLHLGATLLVIVAGVVLHLTIDEWRALAFECTIVWSAEGFNTAIERLCDRVCPSKDPLIGAAKDIAAGAVLIATIGALAIGVTILIPHVAGAVR